MPCKNATVTLIYENIIIYHKSNTYAPYKGLLQDVQMQRR